MTNITALPVATQDRDVSTQAMVFDPAVIAGMQRMGEMMASAKITVPKHLQGSPADCLAIIIQAAQWRMNPYAVAQKTHIINGALGYEAQLVNAVIQQSGAIRGRFHYEYRGEGQSVECRVGAIPVGESDVVWNEWLSAASVTTKNSPLWKTNPKQQLGYLQVKNWARQYVPGALLGVYSVDELEDEPERDMGQALVIPEPTPSASRTNDVKAKLAAKRGKAEPAPEVHEVLSAIASAETLEALEATKPLIKGLTGEDRAQAIDAGKARREALETPPDLELTPPEPVDQILAGIARSSVEDLDIWLEEARIQQIDDEGMARITAAIEGRKA